MVKYVKMIVLVLLMLDLFLPSAILGETDSVSMVIRGSEPFNPKGKFGFQLIFTDLKLSSHTRELGISYYLTPTWEANIQLLADFKHKKDAIKKYDYDFDQNRYINRTGDTLQIMNTFQIALGIKHYLPKKSELSFYYGMYCLMRFPWKYKDYDDYRADNIVYRTYNKSIELGIPLGVKYWITDYLSVSADQAFGASYNYQNEQLLLYFQNKQLLFMPILNDQRFDKKWKYGMLDFHFAIIIHY